MFPSLLYHWVGRWEGMCWSRFRRLFCFGEPAKSGGKNVRSLLKNVVTKRLTWLIPWMQNQATSFDFCQDQWELLLEGCMDKIAQVHRKKSQPRMRENAQRDGRPAEYRWRPLFSAAKFG